MVKPFNQTMTLSTELERKILMQPAGIEKRYKMGPYEKDCSVTGIQKSLVAFLLPNNDNLLTKIFDEEIDEYILLLSTLD